MKALPLWQPWATLVAIEAKRVETRDYPPRRRGLQDGQRIAIHACKTREHLSICSEWPFSDCIFSPEGLPFGALIATCTLARASQVTASSAHALQEMNPREFAFGYYAPGRWAWVLTDVRRLPEPVPFVGSQGVFDVPDEIVSLQPQRVLL